MNNNKPLPRLIHHYSDMTSVALGLLLNTTLLAVVRKNKDTGLESFGQIVMLNCILDLYLTLTTLLAEVEAGTHDGVFYFFANSFLAQRLPPFYHYFLIYFYCLGIGFSVFYTPVPFYQRYMVIVNGVVVSRRAILVVFAIPVLLSFWITNWLIYAMLQMDSEHERLAQLMNNSMWASADGSVPMFAAFPVDTIPALVYLSNCTVCFPLTWSLSAYFFVRISQSFWKNRDQLSERTIRLQKALQRVLISAALFPLFLACLPITLVMITLQIRYDVPYSGIIGTGAVSWIPVFNPLLTLLLIPAYYRALLPRKFIKRLASIATSTNVIPSSATAN